MSRASKGRGGRREEPTTPVPQGRMSARIAGSVAGAVASRTLGADAGKVAEVMAGRMANAVADAVADKATEYAGRANAVADAVADKATEYADRAGAVVARVSDSGMSHFDKDGAAQMVNISAKPETERIAVASGVVEMSPATAEKIRAGTIHKGDVLGVARLAGIAGAKRTSDLIPLCHPVRLTGVQVEFQVGEREVAIVATARAFDRTGVEMEALTAVSAAALTIYDMCKSIDRGMTIGPMRLDEKRGGRSGLWRR